MASAVLAQRYNAAPGKPATANQNRGATTESLRFSDNEDKAAWRTAASSSDDTSRLTSRDSCACPACSDTAKAVSTCCTSWCNMRHASKGLSNNPSSTACSQSGTKATRPASSAAPPATTTAPTIQPRAPRPHGPQRCSAPTWAGGAAQRPSHAKACPMAATGCQRSGGSPSQRSASRATPIATPGLRMAIQAGARSCISALSLQCHAAPAPRPGRRV